MNKLCFSARLRFLTSVCQRKGPQSVLLATAPPTAPISPPLADPAPNGKASRLSQHHAAQETLIDLSGVVKEYTTAAGPFVALKGIDLQIERGEFVAIVGKSGSGKSTLINMITGIDRPTAGIVRVAGVTLNQLSEGALAVWRGRNLGIIFQFFQLLPTLTVAENVMLPMDFAGLGTARERRARAQALLERMELAEQADKLPGALSGGQQQRVAIARALANSPALLVADEPTGNLDSRTAEAIFQLFVQLAEGGTTVVMVTHDNDLARRAGRAVMVVDGLVQHEA